MSDSRPSFPGPRSALALAAVALATLACGPEPLAPAPAASGGCAAHARTEQRRLVLLPGATAPSRLALAAARPDCPATLAAEVRATGAPLGAEELDLRLAASCGAPIDPLDEAGASLPLAPRTIGTWSLTGAVRRSQLEACRDGVLEPVGTWVSVARGARPGRRAIVVELRHDYVPFESWDAGDCPRAPLDVVSRAAVPARVTVRAADGAEHVLTLAPGARALLWAAPGPAETRAETLEGAPIGAAETRLLDCPETHWRVGEPPPEPPTPMPWPQDVNSG